MATTPHPPSRRLALRISRLPAAHGRCARLVFLAEVAIALAHPGFVLVHLAVSGVVHVAWAHRHQR
jgi:hypothetical protein